MSATVSIIIPTYNEAQGIQSLLYYLFNCVSETAPEIIVADGGSTDETCMLAQLAGARVVHSPKKGRAAQMNAGAAQASGEILYFLHADTFPPPDFLQLIQRNCSSKYGAGCFRLQFNKKHWFLKLNAWFTRFDVDTIRFGDQSLYVLKDHFMKIGGFCDDLLLMEDQEIIYRIKKRTNFNVLPAAVTTSAQKYLDNGVYRLQLVFFYIWLLYYLGYSQQRLVKVYNKLIKRSKLKDETYMRQN
ncbi:TIGR04283 family arsenosugar biosynthesis glycosyltransferase [uncultured Pontibacter sp.]|uniref:TIGR04283 family arsenosugar biosynthesis glycosyltransferase n=1 Tax=uncultured Pontibacter sp. TaxID=453356 RepID=UPI00260CDDF5|nr:TIGR04283 family arsenosugar biosynthesis glycosyltransferase [uncultured Pontibacter sp.]